MAHTADEIVADLHGLLHTASIREPYVLVAHSIVGIYTRKYADLYPAEVAGMVLVDSAHEEQFTRVAQISPEWAKRISSQFPADEQRSQGFLLETLNLASGSNVLFLFQGQRVDIGGRGVANHQRFVGGIQLKP